MSFPWLPSSRGVFRRRKPFRVAEYVVGQREEKNELGPKGDMQKYCAFVSCVSSWTSRLSNLLVSPTQPILDLPPAPSPKRRRSKCDTPHHFSHRDGMVNETELRMAMTACATGFCRLHRIDPPPDRTFHSLAQEAFLHQVRIRKILVGPCAYSEAAVLPFGLVMEY